MKQTPKERLITDKQIGILKYIIQFKKDHPYSPTIREVADGMNITVKGAYDHITALIKKGYLSSTPNISRSIEVIKFPETAA